jgi:circadian clock protein KaiC
LTQAAQEQAAVLAQEQELERKERTLARMRAAFEAELAALRAKFEAEQADLATGIDEQRSRATRLRDDRRMIAESRGADAASSGNGRRQGDQSDVGDQRSKAR